MNPGLAALAVGIGAAGVLALATRDTRSAIVATLVVLVASPVLTGTLPEPMPLAARLIAAILAAYVLWAAVRGHRATAGSPLGWQAEALVAAAAGIAGWSVASGLGEAASAPPEATAAGTALFVLAAAPMLAGRDALRTTIATLLAVQGAWLVVAGIAGQARPLDELAVAVLLGTLGAVGAALVARAIAGSGSLALGARRPIGAREASPPPEPAPGGTGRRRAGRA